MKKVADASAYIFILAVMILGLVSILGIWSVFTDDVILKSFLSIGLLAVVAIIIIVAESFIDKPTTKVEVGSQVTQISETAVSDNAEIFKGIRVFTLWILVLTLSVLAVIGVLAIWEVVGGDVFAKTASSIAVVAFCALVIVITCLQRERSGINKHVTGWTVFLAIIFIWFIASAIITYFL